MKNLLIVILFSFHCLSVKAQTNGQTESKFRTGLTESELQKAIKAYIDMTETETYKANKKATLKMVEKLNQKVTPKELMNDEQWEKWITENLKKTKFISVGEANKLRNLCLELTKKQLAENAELYQMIKKATVEQGLEILKPERPIRPF